MIKKEIPKKFKKLHKGTFGLEIETEAKSYPEGFLELSEKGGKEFYALPMEMWEGHIDPSLRNIGIEYVLKEPLSYPKVREALEEFRFVTASAGVEFLKDQPGTSVHVHVNLLEEEVSTLGSFLTLWFLFENILTDFSGESRLTNLFALPVRCAEGVYKKAVEMFVRVSKGDGSGFCISENEAKYGAINLCPIWKFGSIEVRSFRGTTDVDEIYDWVSVINRMLLYSRNKTPPEIIETYREVRSELFFKVFGSYSEKILSSIDPGMLKPYIERNLFYAGVGIASSVSDWTAINTAVSKKKEASLVNPMVISGASSTPQPMTNLEEVFYQWQSFTTPISEEEDSDDLPA